MLQSDDSLKGSVALQHLGPAQTMHTNDDRVNDGQDEIGRMVRAGALGEADPFLKPPLQLQFFAKPMNQEDSPEVRQVAFSDGNVYFSQSFGHWAQC